MRLDIYLVENGLAQSRTRSAELIREGLVRVNGSTQTKPSFDVSNGDSVELVDGGLKYVSRGALKLVAAADFWHLDFTDAVAIDLGASTGGFTEVMLERDVKKVYAVDVGRGQLHERIAKHPKVIRLEGVNARYIDADTFGERADFVCADLSFISQTLVLEAVTRVLKEGGIYVGLIKPQFEVGKQKLGKNGIVKDKKFHTDAAEKVIAFASSVGLICEGIIPSPIAGGDGNREFLAKYVYKSPSAVIPTRADIRKITEN